jgi:CsoR family transcriptional regulator, copper-sensing transcriptional repressor
VAVPAAAGREAEMTTQTGARESRDQLVVRLRRAEGQLRGVQRMLDEGADCQEVLTQLSAAKAAIDQVGLHLITEQLRSCAQGGGVECGDAFDEAVATFLRYATLAR